MSNEIKLPELLSEAADEFGCQCGHPRCSKQELRSRLLAAKEAVELDRASRPAPATQVETRSVDVEAVAWLEPGTLNSCEPDRMDWLRTTEHAADYKHWFPVYATPPAVSKPKAAIDLSKLQRWEMELWSNGSSGYVREYKDDDGDWVLYEDVAALIEGETK